MVRPGGFRQVVRLLLSHSAHLVTVGWSFATFVVRSFAAFEASLGDFVAVKRISTVTP